MKVVILQTKEILITQIEEVGADIGEPDCKLVKPFLIKSPSAVGLMLELEPWNFDYTSQDNFMISSDKIITLADPKPTLLEKYQSLIK